jgi:hypothetical protein
MESLWIGEAVWRKNKSFKYDSEDPDAVYVPLWLPAIISDRVALVSKRDQKVTLFVKLEDDFPLPAGEDRIQRFT